MKKIAFIISMFVLAVSLPLQASAASLYEVRDAVKKYYFGNITGDIYDAQTIDELMDMIDDPYTVYFTKEQYQAFSQSLENETIGIGVVVEAHEKGIYISEVLNNGPAYSAGLKHGDIITHADGISLISLPLNEAVSHITGQENTSVSLTILREDGSSNSISIVRKTIQTPNIVSTLLYGKVGYIHLSTYSEKAGKEVSDAISSLKKLGATQFIFDIQNNTGGYVDSAIDVISLFPGSKVSFIMYDADGKYVVETADEMSYAARYYSKFPTNTSLLINGWSASASDMTAGAVKDQKLGTIYGTTSYGKGLMQGIHEFKDGSVLKVTIAEFRTPNGNTINNIGIEPDVETATPIEDAHLNAIVSQLPKYKEIKVLKNVPTNKTFTISLSNNVQANSVNNSIELVQLGNQKVEISTKVIDSKIIVTPKQPLVAGAQYLLIAHPTIKNAQGRNLKSGRHMLITVQK